MEENPITLDPEVEAEVFVLDKEMGCKIAFENTCS
jgi:hypothetical protein